MDQWSGILIAVLLAFLCAVIGRKYLRRKPVAPALGLVFPPPESDEIWRAMQRAFKTAMPYKPMPETDARFSEDELYLMSLELLEFLLAIEEEVGLKVASEDLPDSALESLSALYGHIKGLSDARTAT